MPRGPPPFSYLGHAASSIAGQPPSLFTTTYHHHSSPPNAKISSPPPSLSHSQFLRLLNPTIKPMDPLAQTRPSLLAEACSCPTTIISSLTASHHRGPTITALHPGSAKSMAATSTTTPACRRQPEPTAAPLLHLHHFRHRIRASRSDKPPLDPIFLPFATGSKPSRSDNPRSIHLRPPLLPHHRHHHHLHPLQPFTAPTFTIGREPIHQPSPSSSTNSQNRHHNRPVNPPSLRPNHLLLLLLLLLHNPANPDASPRLSSSALLRIAVSSPNKPLPPHNHKQIQHSSLSPPSSGL